MKSEFSLWTNDSLSIPVWISRIVYFHGALRVESVYLLPGSHTLVHGERDKEWMCTREVPTEEDAKAMLVAYTLSHP
jgi:hypothetical protein